jgi:hypothetical protein
MNAVRIEPLEMAKQVVWGMVKTNAAAEPSNKPKRQSQE